MEDFNKYIEDTCKKFGVILTVPRNKPLDISAPLTEDTIRTVFRTIPNGERLSEALSKNAQNEIPFLYRVSFWKLLSEHQGELSLISSKGEVRSNFPTYELPIILSNENITYINGIPRSQLQMEWDSNHRIGRVMSMLGMANGNEQTNFEISIPSIVHDNLPIEVQKIIRTVNEAYATKERISLKDAELVDMQQSLASYVELSKSIKNPLLFAERGLSSSHKNLPGLNSSVEITRQLNNIAKNEILQTYTKLETLKYRIRR